MSKKTKYIDAKRRGFMQGSVVAGGAVATGAVNAAVNDAGDLNEDVTPAKNAGHAGYRLTDKVRRYYQRARF